MEKAAGSVASMRLKVLAAIVVLVVSVLATYWLSPCVLGCPSDDVGPGTEDPQLMATVTADIERLVRERAINFIDATRNYVRENSDHGKPVQGGRGSPSRARVLEMLHKASIHAPGSERPTIACYIHADVMSHILKANGYRTRTVRALSSLHDPVQDHTLLEVFNPASGGWELHDPNYNVKYLKRSTGKVASLADVATIDEIADALVPCVMGNRGGCGWAASDVHFLLENGYFAAFEIRHEDIVFINHRRADFSRKYKLAYRPNELLTLRDAFLQSMESGGKPTTIIEIW